MNTTPASSTAVVLLNLGSPDSPATADVRRYLDEFLNDPYVIDIPYLLRKLLVNGIILNTRPKKSAEAYEKVWTKDGSPLLFHTKNLSEKLSKQTKHTVIYAMRYGSPSIANTIEKLKALAPSNIIFIPLYPQYSYAASESSIVEFTRATKQGLPHATLTVVEDFFQNETLLTGFIRSVANTIRPVWIAKKPDLLFYSYHGIPERQIAKIKNKPEVCCAPGCCETLSNKNAQCYRAQCYETTRLINRELGLSTEQTMVGFQSRLGRTKWIEPYTDLMLPELPKKGIKRILVTAPSFTADCLETLEEIAIRYRELFLNAGGEMFEYVPCVNSNDDFVDAITTTIDSQR